MKSILDRILAAILGTLLPNLNIVQNDVLVLAGELSDASDQLDAIEKAVAQNKALLDQILNILLEPAPIAGAIITLTHEGEEMAFNYKPKAAAKAALDFQLGDGGKATGTITFVDTFGEKTQPATGATVSTAVTVSDPASLQVSVDPTGLIISIAPQSPLPNPLTTGNVVTAVITITNPDGTVLTLTAVSEGIDLVAGGPAGASIALAS